MEKNRSNFMKKTTGIVREIDELGRIVLPKELRTTLGIKEGEVVEYFHDDQTETIFRKKI